MKRDSDQVIAFEGARITNGPHCRGRSTLKELIRRD